MAEFSIDPQANRKINPPKEHQQEQEHDLEMHMENDEVLTIDAPDEDFLQEDETVKPSSSTNRNVDETLEPSSTNRKKVSETFPRCGPEDKLFWSQPRTYKTWSKNKPELCPILSEECGYIQKNTKRHLMVCHLPPYANPFDICWGCGYELDKKGECRKCTQTSSFSNETLIDYVLLMNGLLHLVREHVGLQSLSELVKYVTEKKFYVNEEGIVSIEEAMLMDFYDSFNGFEQGRTRRVSPPNSAGSLLEFRNLSIVIRLLSAQKLRELPAYASPKDGLGQICQDTSYQDIGIDAHVHLEKMEQKGVHLKLKEGEKPVEAVVTNYCFPHSWPTSDKNWQPRVKAGVHIYTCLGYHPKSVNADYMDQVAKLRKLVARSHRDIVAIGEVGINIELDERGQPVGNMPLQKAAIRETARIACQYKLPLVIHCRDDSHGRSASDHCLSVLVNELPQGHKIYRHSFNGSIEEYQEWKEAFPNLMVGISGLLLRDNRHPGLQGAVREIPLSCILLETDSPYLHPDVTQLNRPSTIYMVARRVAILEGVPSNMIVTVSRTNAR